MNDNMIGISIIASEARNEVAKHSGVKDKLLAAMRVAHGHWMVLDEDEQFHGAVAAVLLDGSCPEIDKNRIKYELSILKALSAAASGVPVNFSQLIVDEPNPIGLRDLWLSIRPKAAP